MPSRSRVAAIAAAIATAITLIVDGVVALASEHNAVKAAIGLHPAATIRGTTGYDALVGIEFAFALLYLTLAYMIKARERTNAWVILALLALIGLTGLATPNATNVTLGVASAVALSATVDHYRNRPRAEEAPAT